MQLPQEHPFLVFKFCPHCGEPGFTSTSVKTMQCPACGLLWYYNPAPAVIALIPNAQKELLFTRRKYEPAAGMLDLPGGFVNIMETSENALIREIKEETGLEVISFKYLKSIPNRYVYQNLLYYSLDAVFVCLVHHHHNPVPNDDVSELMWLDPLKIDIHQVGLGSINKLIKEIQRKESLYHKIFED